MVPEFVNLEELEGLAKQCMTPWVALRLRFCAAVPHSANAGATLAALRDAALRFHVRLCARRGPVRAAHPR